MGYMLRQAFDAAPIKPRENDPCNGCGICCILDPCRIATEWLHATNKCPALEWSQQDKRFYCGMVRDPCRHLATAQGIDHLGKEDPPPEVTKRYSDYFVAALGGVDRGCDSEDY